MLIEDRAPRHLAEQRTGSDNGAVQNVKTALPPIVPSST
jgi:hypothetical protein